MPKTSRVPGSMAPLKNPMLNRETAIYSLEIWDLNKLTPYNPDSLVRKKGMPVYREMVQRDDAVKSALFTKKASRMASGWDYLPPDPDVEPRGEEMVAFIKHNFEWMKGTDSQMIWDVMGAFEFGFSVLEENWAVIKDGSKWEGKIGTWSIKSKDSADFDPKIDEYGNMTGIIQGKGTQYHRDLDVEKFMYHVNFFERGNYYGNSDLRPAYRPYYVKDMLTRFMGIYFEKYAMPIAIGKYPVDLVSSEEPKSEGQGTKSMAEAERERFEKVLKKIATATAMVIPSDYEVDFAESRGRGESGYLNAFRYLDIAIARAILLPALVTGTSDTGKGTLAQSRTHQESFMNVVMMLADPIETTINEQLIRKLIDINFDKPKAYPKFKFRDYDKQISQRVVDIFDKLIARGVLDESDAKWIRNQIGLPERPEDAPPPNFRSRGEYGPVSTSGGEILAPGGAPAKAPTPRPRRTKRSSPAKEKEEFAETLGRNNGPYSAGPGGKCKCTKCGYEMSHDAGTPCTKLKCPKCGGKMLRSSQFSEQHCDSIVTLEREEGCYPETRSFLENSVAAMMEAECPPEDWPGKMNATDYIVHINDIFEFAEKTGRKSDAERFKADLNMKPSRKLSTPEKRVDYNGIQASWRALIEQTLATMTNNMALLKDQMLPKVRSLYERGDDQAFDSLQVPSKPISTFKNAVNQMFLTDFVLGYNNSIQEVEKATGKDLSQFAEVDGILADPAEALQALTLKRPRLRRFLKTYSRRSFTIAGVERARILNEARRVLEIGVQRGYSTDRVVRELGAVLDKYTDRLVKGEVVKPGRLQTIVRTNLSEAFNTARRMAFEDPAIYPYIGAYQYSAVIDRKTTEICLDYDGTTRPTDDAIWDVIWPPNHFSCRSMVVAWMEDENFTFTDYPTLPPQEGFGV